MNILNPIQMNDWEINKFIKVVLSIQVAVIGLICLEALGLKIPVIREIFGLIYLLFIPGILILRLMKLHNLGNIETLLYSVGLSITSIMLIGISINTLYPLIGINKPLEMIPLILTMSTSIIVLCFFSYVLDKDFQNPNFINLKNIISAPSLFLCFILFITILGVFLFNYYDNSLGFMFMIIIIAFIIFLIAIDKFIPKKLYPLAIFVIGISLLYHTWLISSSIVGRDIFSEVYVSKLVLENYYWYNTIPSSAALPSISTNSMMILTFFAPIVSTITNINIIWIYKLIFPSLFALIPLGLYQLFLKQTSDKIAFLSSFLFIIMGFYSILLISVKQASATLFVVLLLLSLLRNNDIKFNTLSLIFLFSIVVSHYGTTYLMIFYILAGFLILAIINLNIIKSLINSNKKNLTFLKYKNHRIKFNFIIFFIVISLSWYIFSSNSSAFVTIMNLGSHIYGNIGDFLVPESTQGLEIVIKTPGTFFGHLHKYLILVVQMFIVIGFIKTMIQDEMKFKIEFIIISIPALISNFLAILLPSFSSAIYTPRLYLINLIFLAPFAIIGIISFFKYIKSLSKYQNSAIKVVSVIFILLFLLQTGFIKEITQDPPSSISLGKDRMMKSNDDMTKASFFMDYNVFEQDFYGVQWLSNRKISNMGNGRSAKIYADMSSLKSLNTFNIKLFNDWKPFNKNTNIENQNYLYLSYSNIKGKIFFNVNDLNKNDVDIEKFEAYETKLKDLNIIYSNGGSRIYYS